jgi:hypothetical protein
VIRRRQGLDESLQVEIGKFAFRSRAFPNGTWRNSRRIVPINRSTKGVWQLRTVLTSSIPKTADSRPSGGVLRPKFLLVIVASASAAPTAKLCADCGGGGATLPYSRRIRRHGSLPSSSVSDLVEFHERNLEWNHQRCGLRPNRTPAGHLRGEWEHHLCRAIRSRDC